MSIAATCIVKEYKSFGHMSEGVSANLLLVKHGAGKDDSLQP